MTEEGAKRIIETFKENFQKMSYEEREEYLKEYGFSFGNPTTYKEILDSIKNIENRILKIKNQEPSFYSTCLKQIRQHREDLYSALNNDQENKEEIIKVLIEDFKAMCNYNYKLITTRSLSNRAFDAIMDDILLNLKRIGKLDEEKSCLANANKFFERLSEYFKSHPTALNNFRAREINMKVRVYNANLGKNQ